MANQHQIVDIAVDSGSIGLCTCVLHAEGRKGRQGEWESGQGRWGYRNFKGLLGVYGTSTSYQLGWGGSGKSNEQTKINSTAACVQMAVQVSDMGLCYLQKTLTAQMPNLRPCKVCKSNLFFHAVQEPVDPRRHR